MVIITEKMLTKLQPGNKLTNSSLPPDFILIKANHCQLLHFIDVSMILLCHTVNKKEN